MTKVVVHLTAKDADHQDVEEGRSLCGRDLVYVWNHDTNKNNYWLNPKDYIDYLRDPVTFDLDGRVCKRCLKSKLLVYLDIIATTL